MGRYTMWGFREQIQGANSDFIESGVICVFSLDKWLVYRIL